MAATSVILPSAADAYGHGYGGYRGGYHGGYYGHGYYYGPSFYFGPGYPGYYYGDYPPTVVTAVPGTVIQAPTTAFWYFCPASNTYYPYATVCAVPWQAVAARPAPQQQAAPSTVPVPAPQGKVVYRLGGVLFDTGRAGLEPAASQTLEAILESVRKDPNRRLIVEGHTDSTGTAAENEALSRERANAVMGYLIEHGIPSSQITAVGKGAAEPIASNDTADGRKQNRRVDIVVR